MMTQTAARCPVLIVEDDEDLREMMAQMLTLEGFQAVAVANGREALAYLHESESGRLPNFAPDNREALMWDEAISNAIDSGSGNINLRCV